ncbi:MAG: ribonuclease HI family protein [Actinomycetota bacterium]
MTRESGQYRLFTDGAARGNPGPAGIGAVLEGPDGEVVGTLSRGIGWATNNVAEYQALIDGLGLAAAHGVRRLLVRSDSSLLVQQMRGAFKVRHPGLKPLHALAVKLVHGFDAVRFEAVRRESNRQADRLANEGIDADNPGARPPGSAEERLF